MWRCNLLKRRPTAHYCYMTEHDSLDRSPRTNAAVREVDCLIVGGGAAGLSAAINLGRMRRSVIVVDDKDRFRWRHPIHNYLGFPDGIKAADLRRLGRRQAAKYGAAFILGTVAAAVPDGDRFRLRIEALADFRGRRAAPDPRSTARTRSWPALPNGFRKAAPSKSWRARSSWPREYAATSPSSRVARTASA